MALEKVSEILKMADRAKTSAIAFNCVDYPMIKSVVKVAEELNKPTIIMLYPEHARDKHWTTPAVFAAAVKTEAKKVKVPIGLHLDIAAIMIISWQPSKKGFNPSCMTDPCCRWKKTSKTPGK